MADNYDLIYKNKEKIKKVIDTEILKLSIVQEDLIIPCQQNNTKRLPLVID